MKRPIRRLILTAAALSLILPVVFLTALSLFLESENGCRLVKSRINDAIPGSVLWTGADFSLLRGTIELKEVALRDGNDRNIAGLDRLSVRISLPDLLKGTLTLERLDFENPRVALETDETGRLNIVSALLPEEKYRAPRRDDTRPASGIIFRNIVIREARLLGGTFRFTGAENAYRLKIENINATGRFNLLDETTCLHLALDEILFGDGRYTVDSVELETCRKGDVLETLVIKAELEESRAFLRGTIKNIISAPLFDLNLDATLSQEDLDRWAPFDYPLKGTASVKARIIGTPGNPDITLNLEQRTAPADDVPVDCFSASVRLADKKIIFDPVVLACADGETIVTATVDLRKAFPDGFTAPPAPSFEDILSYTLKMDQRKIPLNRLHPAFGSIEGTLVSSSIQIQGRGMSPGRLRAHASLLARIEDLDAASNDRVIPLVTIQSQFSADSGTFRAESLQVRTLDSLLDIAGFFNHIDGNIGGSIKLTVPRLDEPALLLADLPLKGSAELKGFLEGTWPRPKASFTGQAVGIACGDTRQVDLDVAARLDERGRVVLEHAGISSGESLLTVKGETDLFKEDLSGLQEDPAFRLHAEADSLRVEDFIDQGRGWLTLSCDLDGTLREPSGTVVLEGRNLATDFQDMNRLSLAAVIGGRSLNITSFRAETAAGESVEGSGSVGLDRTFEVEVSSRGISLASFNALKDRDMFSGTLAFSLRGSGTLEKPEITGDIALRDIAVRGAGHDDFEGELSVRDGIVRLQGNAGFDADASYHIDDGSISIMLHADALTLHPYFFMAGITNLDGKLDGSLTFEGFVQNLIDGTAHAAIDHLTVVSEELGETRAENLEIAYIGRTFRLAPAVLHLPLDQTLNVEGTFGLDGTVAVSADGEFPLAPFAALTGDLGDFSGTAKVSGRADGTFGKPEMHADIEINDGGFRLFKLASPTFHTINGAIQLRGSTVTLDMLTGSMDGGDFRVAGTLSLMNMKPHFADIRITGRHLPLEIPDTLDARLAADLTLRGRDGTFDLEGGITILEALYYRDVGLRHLVDAVTAAALPAPPREPAATGGFPGSIRLDLSVGHRAPLSLSNNLADLDLVPDLRILGTAAQPVVNGRVSVQSGTVYYQRREFVVTRGVVDFLNPYRTEPSLDIEGRVSVNEHVVTLRITGPPDQLVFNLTSDPPEEQGAILSLLLTGKTTEELTGHSGNAMQNTADIVAAIINATMAEDVRRTTGLDIFELEVSGEDSDVFTEQFRVTMGKELSRRLAFKYSFHTEQGELVQRVSSEYKLLENILAGIFQDNRGVFGGGIRFRLEFY
ncbi:MAG: hypothetical protein AVO39_10775 [delta proteobacterium MLS_D]|jgi:translocation and assembly module TamB|nr:MAG: hypothetical protein AVO39_10775 [delta proteobacterium MLS_D]